MGVYFTKHIEYKKIQDLEGKSCYPQNFGKKHKNGANFALIFPFKHILFNRPGVAGLFYKQLCHSLTDGYTANLKPE